MPAYESVIGLEVHAQLKTRTKIFCGCPTTFGAAPNSQICPVCLGHPGELPVLNRHAVELALRGALALGCEIQPYSVFSRKNYFYPDLPKGFQITQFDRPLATGGRVELELEGRPHQVQLERLHLEEDAGKSIQDGMTDSADRTYVDLNRAGVPLIEIVSRPDLRSPAEAHRCLQRLRSLLRYAGVCDGNMEEGSLRCDANVSVRPLGATELGTRTELKNLNSLRNVERAVEFEIARQIELIDSGGQVRQQTVLWDAGAGVTRPMRGKEEAEDYRYFPEPDLPPVQVDSAWIDRARNDLPELPAARKARLIQEFGLSEDDAHRLTLEAGPAEYFEKVALKSGNPRSAANFVLNDLTRELRGRRWDESIPLPAERLAELVALIDEGVVSVSVARQELFPAIYRSGRSPRDLVAELGLQQMDDDQALVDLVRQVIAASPDQVARYRAGKQGLLGFLVGQVMKASSGRANPKKVGELLCRELGEGDQ